MQTRRKILICAANEQSFQNVKILCADIGLDNEVFWLDMSKTYHQNIVAPNFEHKKIELPFQLSKSFYLSGRLKRLLSLFKLRKVELPIKEFDLVILGDLGALEYTILQRVNSKHTIFIQDAILLWKDNRGLFKKLRSIYYRRSRYSICDEIVCSGEVTKNTLLRNGASPNIIKSIGIPRFEKSNYSISINEESAKTFLFIGEAYSWHGYEKLQSKQAEIIQYLDRIQLEMPDDIKIKVRLHPRDSEIYTADNISLVTSKTEPLDKSLSNSHCLISYGYPSTVVFEAAQFHIPSIFVEEESINYQEVTNLDRFLQLVSFTSLSELKQAIIEFEQPDFENLNELTGFFINQDVSSYREYVKSMK